MSAIVNTSIDMQSSAASTARARTVNRTRPFYWSVRRELWQHRSLYVAPIALAVLLLIAAACVASELPRLMRTFATRESPLYSDILSGAYSVVALTLIATSVIVSCFYCLDALYGERHDRSVLFWKSMPVSDLLTVLAKLSVPMLVMPVFSFALITALHLIMLVVSSLIVAANGMSVGALLSLLPLVDMPVGVLYFLLTLALWYAPVYAALLLTSALAPRAPFVWATIPVLGAFAFEKIAFHTSLISGWLTSRLAGNFDAAFSLRVMAGDVAEKVAQAVEPSTRNGRHGNFAPDPVKFFANPELWIGLIIAAALIGATIWLRRRREPS